MRKLNHIWKTTLKASFKILFIILICKTPLADDIQINIKGNKFTDENVILSIIKNKPSEISDEYSNYLLKSLDKSKLFKSVSVKIVDNTYEIKIEEFENINKIIFNKNERLKDEELLKIANEIKLINLNPKIINAYTSEVQKIYKSFGYNNAKINYDLKKYENNTADLIFEIIENEITKIKSIFFEGNNSVKSDELKSIIKSRTKTLLNIFANNNYKSFTVNNDTRIISDYYKNLGYRNIIVDYQIEYLINNKVNIYFKIDEGDKYSISSIKIQDKDNLLDQSKVSFLENKINSENKINKNFSFSRINNFKDEIADELISNGKEFFEIQPLEKINNKNIDVIFEILSLEPKYTKNINIYGNSRTFEYVIRRELDLSEGDPVNTYQIDKIEKKLRSLGLFESVNIKQKEIDKNLFNIDITVKEKQTGTLNAGVSVGSIDGFSVVAGLSEKNFGGTGKSVKTLLNTSTNKNQFVFEVEDRLLSDNNVDIRYSANYAEEDFSSSSSYKLNTSSIGTGITYDINQNLRHSVDLSYIIKDYIVTNSSTASSVIKNSSGENISFILRNDLNYSTLNSFLIPNNGSIVRYGNIIETPSSSSNGYIKNIITYKNFKNYNKKNIFSFQARLGNIVSLGNNEILTDDKFSLGGRWLRGFDIAGAGPRNSRTSYIGGENLLVTKLDYSRELYDNSDFPIFINFFNDYGLVWQNKTNPTHHDRNLRSSVGFGIKYYSPIGPIGFSWGFPIMDESYDIKRMFLFSVGNID